MKGLGNTVRHATDTKDFSRDDPTAARTTEEVDEINTYGLLQDALTLTAKDALPEDDDSGQEATKDRA